MTHDVFISYSSADGEAVDYIYKYLTESAGLVCWRDKRSIKTGEDFSGVIPEGIEKSALFLVVLSSNSQKSKWVRKEIVFAQSRKKMIPLKIANVDLSPDEEFIFGNVQVLTLGNEDGLTALEEVLKRELEAIPESPWYAAHAKELDQQAKEATDKKKKKEREKARAAKKKESAAMVKAIQSSVRDTAKKMKENLEKDIDATTEEGARVKIKRIRNRVVGMAFILLFLTGAYFGARTWYFTINLEKYLSVEFDGVDTIGTAEVKFDEAAFNKDYSDRIKVTRDQGMEASSLLSSSMKYSLSAQDNLKNGQEIIRSFDLDRMSFQQVTGYRLKYDSSKQVTVEGLKEVELFDPFDNVEVTWNGSDGYGKINIETTRSDSYWGEGEIRVSASENLKNGDIVTLDYVYGDADPTDYLITNYGIAPSVLSKDYTVSGLTNITKFDAFACLDIHYEGMSGSAKIVMETHDLPEGLQFFADKTVEIKNHDKIKITLTDRYGNDPTEYCRSELGMDPVALEEFHTVSGLASYVSDISEINDEQLTRIKDQAKDYIASYAANHWAADAPALESTELVEVLLLTRKSGVVNGFVNKAIFVFSNTISKTNEEDGVKTEKTYYWDLHCENLAVDSNGNYSPEVVEYDPSRDSFRLEFGEKYWSYDGFESLEALKYEYATKNLANYSVQSKTDFSEE